ncbi:MAG: hypothetical protein HY821_13195 [Acidobacteria bacterium]|nr:hypothetical protein [Acidobacteriota bacterium]
MKRRSASVDELWLEADHLHNLALLSHHRFQLARLIYRWARRELLAVLG